MSDQNIQDVPAEAPEETQDQPAVETDNAPEVEVGTSDQESQFESPFNINDVPEEYREHVERYNKQIQGAYTTKTQDLAEQRAQYEAAQDLINWYQALQQEAGADITSEEDILRHLGKRHGWEFPEDEDQEYEDVDQEYDIEDPYHQKVDRMEEFFTEAARQEALNQKVDSIAQDIDTAAKKMGRDFSDEELKFILEASMRVESPDETKQATDQAINLIRKLEADTQTRWIESKKSPQIKNGVPASEGLDLNDTDVRRKYMEDLVNAQQQNT